MNSQLIIKHRKYMAALFGALLLLGLYLIGHYSYLLFHSLSEIFSIVVAFGIFIVAWNSRRFVDNYYLLFIGIAYLFVGGIDMIHTLAYKGMGVFPAYYNSTNLPAQLWIAARYMESISLLLAPLFSGRKIKAEFQIIGYAVVFSLLLPAIFYWEVFPDCFVEGIGLTPFKKISEYIISLILLSSIPLLLRKRKEFDISVLKLLIASIVLTIFSELAFTSYVNAYGSINLIGHFLKIISFYLIYKALIETGLVKPYDLLFRNLKRSEEEIQQRVDFLNSVLESLSTPFYVINAQDYTIRMANSAALAGPLSKGLTCYALTHNNASPCGTTEHPCPVEEIKRTKKPVTVEHIHYNENGDRRNVEVRGYPIFDSYGNVAQVIEYCLDITQRKEEEARKAAEQEMAAQRILSMRSDRLRSLGEMAAGIAHELNQPLQGVRGLAEHLLISVDRGWKLTEEKIRDRSELIIEQADRMVHIIDHIRTFAREAGKPELRPVQVNDVVRSGADMLGTQFRSRGIELKYELADDLPAISANPFSLEEVIINLLINARDAMEEQMKTDSAERPAVVLLRTLLESEPLGNPATTKCVKIEVMDYGTGIPEHIIDKVFDPFFTTKEPDKGTGLGLAISKSIVESFGGLIYIKSAPGEGTTVIVSLPVKE